MAEAQPLPILSTVGDALALIWRRRAQVLRLMWPPALGSTALTAAGLHASRPWGWLPALLQMLLYVWFAVGIHRLILLGTPPGPWRWSRRETRFALLAVGVYLGVGLVVAALVSGATLVVPLVPEAAALAVVPWLSYLGVLPGAYLFARVALAFPAVALDHPVGLDRVWAASAGNGWRLTLLLIAIPSVAWGAANGLIDMAGSRLLSLAWVFLGFLLSAVEIALLSLSYRALQGPPAALAA